VDSIKGIKIEDLLPILDSISTPIFIDDANGNTLLANKASEILYDFDRDEIIGENVCLLEKEGIFSSSVAKLVIENRKKSTIVHNSKSGKQFLSTGTPLFDKDGNISKVITTTHDLTAILDLYQDLSDGSYGKSSGKSTKYKTRKGSLIANSAAMKRLIQMIDKLANIDMTVLITGESGVGKGMVARLIHEHGIRKNAPFIKVNCGAIPNNVIEAELFGYEAGVFSGARRDGKKGFFESAEGGTIFLDEISEMPLNLQVKLLQVIQEKEIRRIGATKTRPIDVRVISATDKDLYDLVSHGFFRDDLYYRLNVVPLNVPPLRERPEDLVPLMRDLLKIANRKANAKKIMDSSAIYSLMKYTWPGNVRELQNIIERMVITTNGNVILKDNIPSYILDAINETKNPMLSSEKNLKEVLESTEKQYILQALRKNKTTRELSKVLGISQASVVRKLNKYNLQPK